MSRKTLFLLLSAVLMGTGCGSNEEKSLLPEGIRLKTGDLVLRCGSGMTSRAVLWADGGGSYSHIGIVVDSAGVKMIVHAVPDEHDGPNDIDRVKMEPPEKFFSSVRTCNGRIMRYPDSIIAQKAAQEAYRIYRKGTLFDHDYDDSDTSTLYCCELVEFAYQKAGVSIVGNSRHDINLPVLQFDHVMLPSDFVKSKAVTTVNVF